MTNHDLEARIADAVMRRVAARRLARARAAVWLWTSSSIIGIAALIPAASYMSSLADQSGFTSYISLLASDGAVLLSAWKPLALSLLESAPVTGAALVLAAILVFGASLARLVVDINRIKLYRHATA